MNEMDEYLVETGIITKNDFGWNQENFNRAISKFQLSCRLSKKRRKRKEKNNIINWENEYYHRINSKFKTINFFDIDNKKNLDYYVEILQHQASCSIEFKNFFYIFDKFDKNIVEIIFDYSKYETGEFIHNTEQYKFNFHFRDDFNLKYDESNGEGGLEGYSCFGEPIGLWIGIGDDCNGCPTYRGYQLSN
jgi:hypothetical protein